MAKRKLTFNIQDLDGLGFEDLMEKFDVDDGITDSMAVDSEEGGDSDAEDDSPNRPTAARPRTRHYHQSVATTSSGPACTFPEIDVDAIEKEPEPRDRIGVQESDDDTIEGDAQDVMMIAPLDDNGGDIEMQMTPIEQPARKRRRVVRPSSKKEDPFTWSQAEDEQRAISRKYEEFIFQEDYGPAVDVPLDNPLVIFSYLLNKEFTSWIVDQSNLYATEKGVSLNLTIEEFNAFVGCLIIMGIDVLPSIKLYWSTNPAVGNSRISSVFTIRRFLQILRHLHLNDNKTFIPSGSPGYDKLHKIRPMLDHFKLSFRKAFNPGRNLAVDESMIPFKGRSSLKQYMPMKPVKRGFKIWALACSGSGYMYNFDFYAGKSQRTQDADSLGNQVVLDLSSEFENRGFCLFFDRFFSSLPLARTLLQKNLFSCSTIMQSRKWFPSNLLKADKLMAYSESCFVRTNDFGLVKWRDRGAKSVAVISTIHEPSDIGTAMRKNAKGTKVSVTCPKSVSSYNSNMGGVDIFDQYMSYYSIQMKSNKWWKKAFYYFLDAAIVNSYVLYKEQFKINQAFDDSNNHDVTDDDAHSSGSEFESPLAGKMKIKTKGKPIKHLEFRLNLADQLIGNFIGRKDNGRTIIITKKETANNVSHINPQLMQKTGHYPKKCKPKRCAVCSTKTDVKRSTIECKMCGVGLCVVPCFDRFHDPEGTSPPEKPVRRRLKRKLVQ